MRAALLLAALLVATPASADPRPPPSPGPTRPPRTIIIKLAPPGPILVDGKQIPKVDLVPLARTPPPRCKKDRRGATRCKVTY